MIAGHFTLWVENQTGIHWLACKALPELRTALPQLVFWYFSVNVEQVTLQNNGLYTIYINHSVSWTFCLIMSGFWIFKFYWGNLYCYQSNPLYKICKTIESQFWFSTFCSFRGCLGLQLLLLQLWGGREISFKKE